MRVHLQQDALSATFSKQLLENGKEKVPIDAVTTAFHFHLIFVQLCHLLKN